MIAIIDYGASNLRSVSKAIDKIGYQSKVTSSPREVLEADIVILPGVGAAGEAMHRLQERDLREAIQQIASENRPLLSVCLGLQLLFGSTEEGGEGCLDILPGVVKKLPSGLKIPHMGWNQVKQKISHPLFWGIEDNAYFYFVHSYYVEPQDKSLIAGETDYGLSFSSVIIKSNLVATQFHPEKSGRWGLRMLQNFLEFITQRRNSS